MEMYKNRSEYCSAAEWQISKRKSVLDESNVLLRNTATFQTCKMCGMFLGLTSSITLINIVVTKNNHVHSQTEKSQHSSVEYS